MTGLEEIKKKSIVEVAGALGVPLKQLSGKLYEHADHDSFKIFADTNTFKWFSRDLQGDVIRFVQVMAEVSFKEALHFLRAGDFPELDVKPRRLEPFRYYLSNQEDHRFLEARQYLKEVRGLSDDTINTFGLQGLLAQALLPTKVGAEPVVVFKLRDHHGRVVGANLQGIVEDRSRHSRGRLKRMMKDSQGSIGFSLTLGQPKRLIFTESAIDAMSYYECHKQELRDVRLIGMEGLKKSCVAYHILRLVSEERGDFQFLDNDVDYNRLSHLLDLVKDTTTFFQTHEHVITLAVDNDEAGREFVANFKEQGFPVQLDLPPLISGQDKADWNDVLVRQAKEPELEDMIAQVKAELPHGPVLVRSAMSLDL